MRIEILTLFPEIFTGFLNSSLLAKARSRGLIEVRLTNIRDFASPPHFKVDDTPYGGGGGMLMKPEPLAAAIEAAKGRLTTAPVVLLTPSGQLFKQSRAEEVSREAEIILICGRYEGVDQRVVDLLVDVEISIGDYVLMGGELPAMVVIEAVVRLQEDVLGNSQSPLEESFTGDCPLLEAPHYTRPPTFRGLDVPEVLVSGDHKSIAKWRRDQSLLKTKERRPDLLQSGEGG